MGGWLRRCPLTFDAHVHLQDPRYDADREAVIARALASGVTAMAVCGTCEADWPGVLDLARRQPAIRPLVGLHPWFVARAAPGWASRLEALLEATGAGLGEAGLDFADGMPDRGLQEAALRTQLRLARALDRPVALHARGAWERLEALLREEGVPAAGGLVHAYGGSAETARILQGLGLSLSLGCRSADPARAPRVRRVLAAVAPDRLLLETDGPDLAWPPGERNEPARLEALVRALAPLADEAPEALARRTTDNAMRMLGGLRP